MIHNMKHQHVSEIRFANLNPFYVIFVISHLEKVLTIHIIYSFNANFWLQAVDTFQPYTQYHEQNNYWNYWYVQLRLG